MSNNSKDIQSRKYQLTINNPKDKGYSHEDIVRRINGIKNIAYYCMCDEVGENGTYHTHIYIYKASAIRFSTVQNVFAIDIKNDDGTFRKSYPHIEIAKGTSQQNKEYITKSGDKWSKHKKNETNLIETFEEYGDLPVERQGQRNDIHDLYDMINSGMDNHSIIATNPDYMMYIDKIERTRQIIRENKYKDCWRTLDVVYVHGGTGTGKTKGIMESLASYSDVFRVTDYDHPFDSYKGQETIVFEEFRSSLKIQDMLNYLDGYPLELPCRYSNKIACFTKVYITTNLDFLEQYESVQQKHPETFNAFKRRISTIRHYTDKFVYSDYTIDDYLSREIFVKSEQTFEQLEIYG